MARGRFGRLLRTVILGVVLILLLFWALVGFGAPPPREFSKSAEEPPVPRVVEPEPVHEPVPEPEPEPEPEPAKESWLDRSVAEKIELWGSTRFVRRLIAGDRMNMETLPGLLRALLWADRFDRCPQRTGEEALRFLTDPPRNTKALRLSHAPNGDPLGTTMPVRIWTRGPLYPKSEMEMARANLLHVATEASAEIEGGVDVLATLRRGQDVFPHQFDIPSAAGVYYRRDGYCTVKLGLAGPLRREVLKHECIHALMHRMAPRFSRSRFVTEGLAEYLRFVRPGDMGLRVPPERLVHNLARLQLILAYIGPAPFEPAHLLKLTPGQFYAMRGFSYLLAQATMAYVGGDVIERALRARSDELIAEAVRSMRWDGFLHFVAIHAPKGNAARAHTVEDVPSAEEIEPRAALRALGVRIDRKLDPERFKVVPVGLVYTREQRKHVVRILREGEGPLVFAVDRSEEFDRELVLDMFESLRERSPTLVCLGPGSPLLQPRDLEERAGYHSIALLSWLRKRKLTRADLVLFIATDRVRTRRIERSLKRYGVLPRTVLVVDLSKEGQEASRVALAFAKLHGFTGNVAYYKPEKR